VKLKLAKFFKDCEFAKLKILIYDFLDLTKLQIRKNLDFRLKVKLPETFLFTLMV